MKNSNVKKIFYFSIVFFLGTCLLFLFFYTDLKNKNKVAEEKLFIFTKEAQKRSDARSTEQSIKSIENERVLFDNHFVSSSNIVPFLDTLESLGQKAGAKADVSLVDVPKEGDGLLVEMKVAGSFGSIYKFITLLENSPYELQFISVNLDDMLLDSNSQASVNKTYKWQANLQLKLLSFIK